MGIPIYQLVQWDRIFVMPHMALFEHGVQQKPLVYPLETSL
jgi:hypothetical protein